MPCGPGLLAHEERAVISPPTIEVAGALFDKHLVCRTCWLPLVSSIGILPLVTPDAIKRPKTPHAFAGKEPYEPAKLAIARLVVQIASASSRADRALLTALPEPRSSCDRLGAMKCRPC
jgi:hypothetical protein